jgi:hypothetical protein
VPVPGLICSINTLHNRLCSRLKRDGATIRQLVNVADACPMRRIFQQVLLTLARDDACNLGCEGIVSKSGSLALSCRAQSSWGSRSKTRLRPP